MEGKGELPKILGRTQQAIDFEPLAPFGYDLARLIVTLSMTHGPLRPGLLVVLIVGAPRSGTSHLFNLLARHTGFAYFTTVSCWAWPTYNLSSPGHTCTPPSHPPTQTPSSASTTRTPSSSQACATVVAGDGYGRIRPPGVGDAPRAPRAPARSQQLRGTVYWPKPDADALTYGLSRRWRAGRWPVTWHRSNNAPPTKARTRFCSLARFGADTRTLHSDARRRVRAVRTSITSESSGP